MAKSTRLDAPFIASARRDDSSATPMIQATDFFAFNRAAEQVGKPWRLSRLAPRGWQLVNVAGGVALAMPDARSDYEAVKRAIAFLLGEGRL